MHYKKAMKIHSQPSFTCTFLQRPKQICTFRKMNKYVIIAALMIAVAAAMPQSYPSETSNAKPSYDDAPKPYSFDWSVKDDESKNDYGHKESSDGKVVTGSYRVALPDGRTQIVTYKADENGYVADIKYEGEAKYPEPEYKPTPSKY